MRGDQAPPGVRIAGLLAVVVALTIALAWLAGALGLPGLAPWAFHVASLAAVAAALMWEGRGPASIGLAPAGRSFWMDGLIGLAWGALSIAAVAAGMIFVTEELAPHASAGLLEALPYWLAVGVAEEVLFRGYILSALRARWSLAPSAIVSAALFTLVHVINPDFYWFAYLYAFLMGILLAALTAARGGLGLVIGFHVAWNLVQAPGAFDMPARGGEGPFAVVLLVNLAILRLPGLRRGAAAWGR